MSLHSTLKRAGALGLAAAFLSGCAINMQVPIQTPHPSTLAYAPGTHAPVALTFKNEQPASEAQTLTGTIPMKMTYQDKPFDAAPWVAEHTVKEMVARGLPVSQSESGGTPVHIKHLHIENYRSSGFSPFVTFTSLRADVETPQGLQHIAAYVKRGKVPVMSFDEVIEPTYNAPLSLLTKELAAKLNQSLFQQVVPDDQVKAIIAKLEQNGAMPEDAYLDVYQLGFSNNPIATPELVKLSNHSSEYVRLAALSSLGILKATDQFTFLTQRYASNNGLWQDRAMALKAIGDLGTPEALAFLQQQRSHFEGKTDKEARWTLDIIKLYL